jgi:hypothetical protein
MRPRNLRLRYATLVSNGKMRLPRPAAMITMSSMDVSHRAPRTILRSIRLQALSRIRRSCSVGIQVAHAYRPADITVLWNISSFTHSGRWRFSKTLLLPFR